MCTRQKDDGVRRTGIWAHVADLRAVQRALQQHPPEEGFVDAAQYKGRFTDVAHIVRAGRSDNLACFNFVSGLRSEKNARLSSTVCSRAERNQAAENKVIGKPHTRMQWDATLPPPREFCRTSSSVSHQRNVPIRSVVRVDPLELLLTNAVRDVNRQRRPVSKCVSRRAPSGAVFL